VPGVMHGLQLAVLQLVLRRSRQSVRGQFPAGACVRLRAARPAAAPALHERLLCTGVAELMGAQIINTLL
jgi:hypothetical protein